MGALHWNTEALRLQLDPLLPGIEVEVVDTTGSTNTDLLERARAPVPAEDGVGPAHVRRSVESRAFGGARQLPAQTSGLGAAPFTPCLLIAEQQTGGRGRQGRGWVSQRGASLTFSLALPIAAADWSGLSLAVGVALAEALEPEPVVEGRLSIGLKWPNDLWLVDAPGRGRKLGGVLIETVPRGAQRIAVIGIGLNVQPLEAPADVTTGYACLRELDREATAPALLARIAAPLAESLRAFEREGFAPFRSRFAARDLLFGQAVRTTQRDLPDGTAAGIGTDGSLIVRPPQGGERRVASGEVSVRVIGPSPAALACATGRTSSSAAPVQSDGAVKPDTCQAASSAAPARATPRC